MTTVPCTATSVVYNPPSVSSIRSSILGCEKQLTRSGSVLRKSNTSDDELDEISSPLTAIIDATKGSWKSKGSTRYQLLKEVWMNSE